MRKTLILITLFFVSIFSLSAQDAQEQEALQNRREIWNETLLYGIESDVIATINEMIEEEDFSLSSEVEILFDSTRSNLRTKILDYFEAFESDALTENVLAELEFYQDIDSSDFAARLIEYLNRREYQLEIDNWEVLMEMLIEEVPRIQIAIIRYLGNIGFLESADTLLGLYDDADTVIQEQIIQALGKMQNEESRELIFSLARSEFTNTSIRMAALEATGSYAHEDSLNILNSALSSNEPLIRSAAVSALKDFPVNDIETIYFNALRDSNWRVRQAVLLGIESSPFPSAFPALRYMSRNDPETNIQQSAYRTLASLNTNEAWEYLRSSLEDTSISTSLRQTVAVLLIQNNFLESKEVIRRVMISEWEKRESRILDSVCKEMSTTNAQFASDLFIMMLGHSNFVIQIYAVRGIGYNNLLAFRSNVEAIAENENSHPALKMNAQTVLDQFDEGES